MFDRLKIQQIVSNKILTAEVAPAMPGETMVDADDASWDIIENAPLATKTLETLGDSIMEDGVVVELARVLPEESRQNRLILKQVLVCNQTFFDFLVAQGHCCSGPGYKAPGNAFETLIGLWYVRVVGQGEAPPDPAKLEEFDVAFKAWVVQNLIPLALAAYE
ncbi:hypothetical protein C8R46DRAFT_1032688 [Mycena filopes]|nr:hypothetical protein C8R46DRAFT_1032688 [Mycena filopes]